jgi:hypothetical protein
MDLLFNEEWLQSSIKAEEEVGNIGVGFCSDELLEMALVNPELYFRLKTLRISLNREVRLLIQNWNLGTATSTATATAREKLLTRLRLPTPEVRTHIEAVLLKDELFTEEFISNRQILRELVGVMLTQEDWESIASVAADSLRQQIIQQVVIEKISA